MAKEKIISAKDCNFFNYSSTKKDLEPLESFIKSFSRDKVFSFSNRTRDNVVDYEAAPFATWEKDKEKNEWNWRAGRWVGENNDTNTKIIVEPRFGYITLFIMLEEIFSINILKDHKNLSHSNSINFIFRQIIPFIWEQQLANANRYGLPRKNNKNFYEGSKIKGNIDIRKSIIPFFKENKIVSFCYEKQIDSTIALIIQKAYQILSKNRKLKLSDNSQNVINAIKMAHIQNKRVSEAEYQSIQYKSIYQAYKNVVDFSWQIIKNHNFSSQYNESTNGFSCWIDMAEIWELTLLNILKKEFPDWHIESPKNKVYKGTFFERYTIPDIVMTRGNDVAIFDAKWKRMSFKKNDVDREDFFQIHTYISYYRTLGKNVIIAGLLYPLEEKYIKSDYSTSLFGLANNKIQFMINGIVLPKIEEDSKIPEIIQEEFYKNKTSFIENLKQYLS